MRIAEGSRGTLEDQEKFPEGSDLKPGLHSEGRKGRAVWAGLQVQAEGQDLPDPRLGGAWTQAAVPILRWCSFKGRMGMSEGLWLTENLEPLQHSVFVHSLIHSVHIY